MAKKAEELMRYDEYVTYHENLMPGISITSTAILLLYSFEQQYPEKAIQYRLRYSMTKGQTITPIDEDTFMDCLKFYKRGNKEDE